MPQAISTLEEIYSTIPKTVFASVQSSLHFFKLNLTLLLSTHAITFNLKVFVFFLPTLKIVKFTINRFIRLARTFSWSSATLLTKNNYKIEWYLILRIAKKYKHGNICCWSVSLWHRTKTCWMPNATHLKKQENFFNNVENNMRASIQAHNDSKRLVITAV